MGYSPSRRTHRVRPSEELNLTSLIDMITCLMFFLLLFAGMIPVAIIDAPLPKVAATAEEVKRAKDNENNLDVTVYITSAGFNVKVTGAGDKGIAKLADGKYDYVSLHKYLVSVHTKRPKSHEITLIAADDVTYDVMIGVMDAAREKIVGDEGYQQVAPEIAVSQDRLNFNKMFPDVSIGGV